MPSPWTLGIDFGTTFTVAAVHHNGRTDVLEIDGQRRFPSAVFLEADGSVLVGTSAERRGAAAPDRLERTPKRYLDVGQPPIALGGNLVDVTGLVAAVLRVVHDEAVRQYGADLPPTVVLTHPAAWGTRRRELLRQAAADAGMPDAALMAEPVSAAMYLAAERAAGSPIGHGEQVAVYDLGGGTFDACLLRRAGAGFEIVGEPGGDPRIGGEVFDDRLYRQLGQTGLEADDWSRLQASDEPAWVRANWEFRRAVREAKEAVSRDATCPVYVPPPVGRELQVTRAQVESLVRDDIQATIDVLEATVEQGGAAARSLSAVYLVGGSSRMPIVAGMVRDRFGRADTKGDPKHVVALGAARTEAQPAGMSRPAPVVPPPRPAPGLSRRRRRVPLIASTLAILVLGVLAAAAVVLPQSSKNSSSGSGGAPTPTTSPVDTSTPVPTETETATATATATVVATATSTASKYSKVSGTITMKQSGQPAPGITAEFTNLESHYTVTAKTDESGRYGIRLPAGFWEARAEDLSDLGNLSDIKTDFAVAGGANDSITVPPGTTVDFVGSPTGVQ